MRYTISEMAALLGVTTHTLRYYEKMGLIQPEVNRETGYRYYTVTDTRRSSCRICRSSMASVTAVEGSSRKSLHSSSVKPAARSSRHRLNRRVSVTV